MLSKVAATKHQVSMLFTYGLVGRGGDAIQVLDFIQAFRNLGHEVYLIGPNPIQPFEFSSRSGHLRSLLRGLPWWCRDMIEVSLNLLTLLKVGRFLRHQHIDLAFDRAGIYGFVSICLGNNQPYPLVVHLDAPFAEERAFRHDGYFKRLHRMIMRTIGKRAQLITTVSHPAKDYFTELGIPPEKILIQPNGLSQSLLERGEGLAEVHQPFCTGRPYRIGFLGSLTRWHRVDLLLEALKLILAERANQFRLIIIGHGEEYASLIAQAQKLGLKDCIDWLGPMPHEQAFAKIAEFDIAVLPHTLSTGSPLKLFEYASLARPFIAPDLPNLRDIFTDDEVHFIAPENPETLARTLLYIADHQDEAIRRGMRAQKRVMQYTWENYAKEIMERLEKCSLRSTD